MKATIARSVRKSLSMLTISAFALSSLAPIAYAATAPTTVAATSITSADATLNATNGDTAAAGSSFWVSQTSPIDTTNPNLMPAGVYSTLDLGPVGAGAPFSGALSAVMGMPAVTPNTTYYFVAWSDVGGVWSPSSVQLSVTTGPMPTTNAATSITATSSTLNGTATTAAADTSFWYGSTAEGPFSPSASPTLPSGWTSTGLNGAAGAGSPFSAAITGLTQGTTYYFVAWTFVDGVWNPGVVLTFITTSEGTGTIGGGTVTGGTPPEGTLAVTSVTAEDTTATAGGGFENGWRYVFHITVPTTETNLSMKFADWLRSPTPGTIPVASNMRIYSAQSASNTTAGTSVLLTAANTYSSPALSMITDLDAGTAGIQVDIIVEVAVPIGTVNGSYSTSYGVQTLP